MPDRIVAVRHYARRTCPVRGHLRGRAHAGQKAEQERHRPPWKCPICGGELSVSPEGVYIFHDHSDDSPEIDDRLWANLHDPYGWGGY